MRASWVGLAVVLAWIPRAALAQGEDGEGEGDEAGGKSRVATAVFVLPDPGVPNVVTAAVERALEAELRKNKRLAVKDKDKLLAAFAGEVPDDEMTEARAIADAGFRLLDLGRPAEAVKKLEEAVSALEKVLAFVKKQELADAQLALGVARARAGAPDSAIREFARLLSWRPTQVFDVKRYGGDNLQLFEQTRASMPDASRGSLEVTSKPSGAQAFVNGRYVGVTPTVVEGLVVGYHYVTLKLAGYRSAVVKAHVDARFQETSTHDLVVSEKYILVDQSLTKAKSTLGKEEATAGMLDLRAFLFIDHSVFARVESVQKKKGGGYRVHGYVYDLRSKRRLSSVRSDGFAGKGSDAAKNAMTELGRALYSDVSYEAAALDPVRRKRGKKSGGNGWLIWGGVGAVVVGAVVVGVVVASGGGEGGCPDGNDCISIRF